MAQNENSAFLSPDSTNGCVESSSDDDTACLAGRDVCPGEDDVLLVLVDGPGIRDGVGVLDDRHRLAGQDGLVDSQRGRHDLHDPDVSRDLVAN